MGIRIDIALEGWDVFVAGWGRISNVIRERQIVSLRDRFHALIERYEAANGIADEDMVHERWLIDARIQAIELNNESLTAINCEVETENDRLRAQVAELERDIDDTAHYAQTSDP